MIRVGPAGSSGLGNLKGVSKCAEMDLDCMEVEFTYGVRMDLKTAKEVGILARELVKCNPDITIINESPDPYEDAVMMKKVLKED